MYTIKISKTGKFCVGYIDRFGLWVHHCWYLSRQKAERCVAEMDWRQQYYLDQQR